MRKIIYLIALIFIIAACTDKLKEAEKMNQIWHTSMLHLQNNISMREDSLLPEAIKYFRACGDSTKFINGFILEAKYHHWMGQTDSMRNAVNNGLTSAIKLNDTTNIILFLITKSELLASDNNYSEAVLTLKQALSYCPQEINRIYSLLYTIGLYKSLSSDSSYKDDMHRATLMALQAADTSAYVHFARNFADALSSNGQYEESNQIVNRLRQIQPSLWEESSALQLTMAQNYINMHRIEDAEKYLRDAEIKEKTILSMKDKNGHPIDNYAIRSSRILLQSIADFANGRIVSRQPIARFCDSIMIQTINHQNIITRQLETKNQLQQANYELEIDHQRTNTIIAILIITIAVAGLLIYIFIRHRYKSLAEAEERIDALSKMLEQAQNTTSNTDEILFRKLLLRQLGIIKHVATTPTAQNQELLRRISCISNNEIPVDSLLNWDDLYATIDHLYNGFYTFLISHFGNTLSDKEIQICCLLCANFSTKEIGVVTRQSSATIYVRKTSIRKKIGAAEGEDIISHLDSIKTS